MRKDVYGRRLRGLKSRKFVNLHRRYGNVTSALGVLYPYGRPSMAAAWTAIYQRRGLTALLILWRRQCESLRPGISESRNSHVFFRTPHLHQTFTALFGSLRAQKTFYAMKRDEEKRNELQSRREFFKNAAKKTLPILGALVLAGMPSVLRASETELGCKYGCSTGCYTSCNYTCKSTCRDTCKGSCRETCKYTCTGTCKNSCRGGCEYSSR